MRLSAWACTQKTAGRPRVWPIEDAPAHLSRLLTSFVLGYHGCDQNIGEQALAGNLDLIQSDRDVVPARASAKAAQPSRRIRGDERQANPEQRGRASRLAGRSLELVASAMVIAISCCPGR